MTTTHEQVTLDDDLVRRWRPRLWAVALRHGLDQHDAADVVQATWLHLLEHAGDVHHPERVGAWLATTARREALRRITYRQRVIPTDDTPDDADRLAPPLDEQLLAHERAAQVRAALDTLPPTWRALLHALTQDPPPTYTEITSTLGLPIGSIGPTRSRSLTRLRSLIPDPRTS
jgi:RNA polymerase sigma factor (sigma-70 family)